MNRIWIFLLILLNLSDCRRSPKDYQLIDHHLQVTADGGTYEIVAISPAIIRVSFTDSLSPTNNRHAAVLEEAIPMDVQQGEGSITAQTDEVKVRIHLDPFGITFLDKNNRLRLAQEQGHLRRADTSAFRFHFNLMGKEAIYGTGARAIPLNRRGYAFATYNRPQYGYGWGAEALNYSLPHIFSSNNYMLLFDKPGKGRFDIGKTEPKILEFSSLDDNQVYYYIGGDSFHDLIREYTQLTGRQPLPPIWALGHLQSRFGYHTRAEAEAALQAALEAGYPVDAIILDIYWFGPEVEDGRMGELAWDKENWPDPAEMIQSFREKGVKTITVSEPFFTRRSQHFQTLDEQGLLAKNKDGNTFVMPDFFFGEAGLLDIFQPAAKDWVWERYREMKQYGVDGWWVDLGEPELHPDSMVHVNGLATAVHGLYGHEWAAMLAEGTARDYPNERLFQMGRAGYAGSQRYGLIPWTGDVGRNWSGLQAQPTMMLSAGLSGIAYMHSDAGGFSSGEPDAELYIRWLQMATFSPVFRPHGDASVPAEPVFWPDSVQALVKPFIEWRYRMLPYNYTLAWENTQTGMPMARPMFTEFPGVSDTLYNQYMWGGQLLVAPVLQAGLEQMPVYLPEGQWYDFWDHQSVAGGGFQAVKLDLGRIPVFVRAGSLLPTIDPLPNTEAYRGDSLQLTYYFSTQPSRAQLYFDDGKTNHSWKTGDYELWEFTMELDENGLLVIKPQMKGNGYTTAPDKRICTFRLVGRDQAPEQIKKGEQILSYEWDTETRMTSFTTVLEKEIEIEVVY